MSASKRLERVARAIYEARPLRQQSWPGIGEVRPWGNLICYRGSSVDETEPYFMLAEAALKAVDEFDESASP
jgi:hypothetical protein